MRERHPGGGVGPYLFVLNGADRRRARFIEKEITTIGKREDADLQLADPWISWTHAQLVKTDQGFFIEDLDSTNGTFVNLARVVRAEVEDGDVIFCGGTHLLLVTSGRAPSPPPRERRDPQREVYGTTDRMRRRPAEIDLRPVELDDDLAPFDDAEATLRMRVVDVPGIEGLEEDADVDRDAFRAPPPAEDELDALEARLFGKRPEAGAGLAEVSVADMVDEQGRLLPELLEAARRAPPPSASGSLPALEPPDDHRPAPAAPGSGAGEPDRELARLRHQLAHREAQIQELREELLRLKEQYLDM